MTKMERHDAPLRRDRNNPVIDDADVRNKLKEGKKTQEYRHEYKNATREYAVE